MTTKCEQLGIAHSVACQRLRKILLFDMAQRLNLTKCYRCGKEIADINDFTVDHIVPWRDSHDPLGVFLDLKNIAFSHHACNSGAARDGRVPPTHGQDGATLYRDGCRCQKCRDAQARRRRKYRSGRLGLVV